MTFQVPRMDERESAAWLGLVAVSQLLPNALDSQLQREAGMTHFEFMVLTVLQLAPQGTLRMTALAEATVSTLPRLSHVCARLERRGLVERSTCAQDRRATNVHLTSDGRRSLIRAIPNHLATARRVVIDALSPDQLVALAEITSLIRDRLGGGSECGVTRPAGTSPGTTTAQDEA